MMNLFGRCRYPLAREGANWIFFLLIIHVRSAFFLRLGLEIIYTYNILFDLLSTVLNSSGPVGVQY